MKKPIIAIDIDDVLAANAEGFTRFSNETWGHDFTPLDYDENWTELWGVDDTEAERRSVYLHNSGVIGRYKHFKEARAILQRLNKKFDLVIVTSRRQLVVEETRLWINTHFPDTFSAIHFAGLYDDGTGSAAYSKTKADVLQKIGASYLIDDQLKHCIAAQNSGITALLFGMYSWNKDAPPQLKRCVSWQEVEEFLL